MLPKKARLSRELDIRATTRSKQYENSCPLLYFVARENLRENSRLAVVTPKCVGGAVERNKARRVFQSAFLKFWHKLAKNVDMVFIIRKSAIGVNANDVAKALANCLKRNHLYVKNH